MSSATNLPTASQLSKRVVGQGIASVFVLFATLMFLAVAFNPQYWIGHLQRSILGSSRGVLTERAVTRIHEQLNAGQYGEIYAQSTAELKQTISEAEFTQRLAEIRLRLGAVDGLARVGEKRLKAFKINVKPFDGVYVTLLYETAYGLAQLDETFVFLTSGEQAQLSSYEITSPILRALDAELNTATPNRQSAESSTAAPIRIDPKDMEWKTQPDGTIHLRVTKPVTVPQQ